MPIIITEIYFVSHGNPIGGPNIMPFLVGAGKPIPNPFVHSGDVFIFTHHQILNDYGMMYDPYPGHRKNIIVVLNVDGTRTPLNPFPESEEPHRLITVLIP